MSTEDYPKLRAWVVGSMTVSPVSWAVIFYVFLHVLLGVGLRQLLLPYMAICIAWAMLSPLLYLSRKHWVQRGCLKTMTLTVGAAYLIVGAMGVFWGIRLGLLPPQRANVYYGVVLAVATVGPVGFYCGRRLLFRQR